MEPLNVCREDFPMSTAKAEGMIRMEPKVDNYEIFYYEQNVKARVPQLSYLVQRGFVVAALEYRGSECAVFPAQALDAKAGVAFMKEHAQEYGVNPDNIFLMGDSSGAHTAIIAAFSYGVSEMEEEERKSTKPIVKGVIDLYGPTNFATMNDEPSSQDHRTPDSPEGCEIGRKYVLENPDLVRPAVVANYVSENRVLPPILMFHGTNDELVPFGQGCELFEKLTKAKKEAKFYQVIGAHHGGREFWSEEVLDIEEEFIRKLCE